LSSLRHFLQVAIGLLLVVIAVILVANAVLGYVQGARAEQAVAALQEKQRKKTKGSINE